MPRAILSFLLITLIFDIKKVTCLQCASELVGDSVNALVEGDCLLPVYQHGDLYSQKSTEKEKGEGSLPVVSSSQRFHLFGLCAVEEHQAHASNSPFVRSVIHQEDQQRDGDSIKRPLAFAQDADSFASILRCIAPHATSRGTWFWTGHMCMG